MRQLQRLRKLFSSLREKPESSPVNTNHENTNESFVTSKDQYLKLKIAKIDKHLALNTYVQDPEEGETRLNSSFISRDELSIRQNQKMEMVKNIFHSLKEWSKSSLPLTRKVKETRLASKSMQRPIIEKSSVTDDIRESLKYLSIKESTHPMISRFLQNEKNYLNAHFLVEMEKTQRQTDKWVSFCKDIRQSLDFIADQHIYRIVDHSKGFVIKRDFYNNIQNLKSNLDREQQENEPINFNSVSQLKGIVLQEKEIRAFLLGLKDDLSYYLSRLLKRERIYSSNIVRVTLSTSEKFIIIELNIKGKLIGIVKDLQENTFLNWFIEGDLKPSIVERKSQNMLVLQQPREGKLLYVEIPFTSEDFVQVS